MMEGITMNAELYYITEVGISEADNKNTVEQIKKIFENSDVNVLYQTIIYPSLENIEKAFIETSKSEENIDLIIMVGGLYNSEDCIVKQFFKKYSIDLNPIKPQNNVEMIYSEEGIASGYAINNGKNLVITIPSIADKTPYIIKKYVLSYIIDKENPNNSLKSDESQNKHKRLRSIIPWKGDSIKQVIIKIMLLISIIVLIVSSYMLIDILIIQPRNNKNLNDEIHGMYTVDNNQDYDENGILKKFNELRKINEDIKGWIYIPYTTIDYPVLQSSKDDPTYYLYRDYKKNNNRYGSIFIDANCDLGASPKNIVIHGHHMNDGSMFANILKYNDLEFYKGNPVITFDTIYEIGKWKIISIFKTNTLSSQGELFDYLRTGFSSTDDFLDYVYNVRVRSIINAPVDITDTDRLITLSTCSYELKDFRTVIVARKLRENESADVDVSSAVLNNNVIYPDGWYERYGGSKPSVKKFKDALDNGEINWYKKP